MTFHVTESEPTPDASDKSMIYLAANEDGTGRSFRLLDKSGWKDVSSVGLEPTDGLSRRVRIDLEKGSAESRRVRYSIDGKVLSANGVEWFEMTSGGDIREIVFFGDSEIAAFFGEFCETSELLRRRWKNYWAASFRASRVTRREGRPCQRSFSKTVSSRRLLPRR